MRSWPTGHAASARLRIDSCRWFHPSVESPAVIVGDEAERRVPEGDQRPAVDFGQPVLQVRHNADTT